MLDIFSGTAQGINKRCSSVAKQKHKAKPVCTTESISDASELDDGAFGASSKPYKDGWIVDSGASSHMTQRRELLINYEEFKEPQKVCLGDGRTVEALGKGNIRFVMSFKTSEPKRITMYNALYTTVGLQPFLGEGNVS